MNFFQITNDPLNNINKGLIKGACIILATEILKNLQKCVNLPTGLSKIREKNRHLPATPKLTIILFKIKHI